MFVFHRREKDLLNGNMSLCTVRCATIFAFSAVLPDLESFPSLLGIGKGEYKGINIEFEFKPFHVSSTSRISASRGDARGFRVVVSIYHSICEIFTHPKLEGSKSTPDSRMLF